MASKISGSDDLIVDLAEVGIAGFHTCVDVSATGMSHEVLDEFQISGNAGDIPIDHGIQCVHDALLQPALRVLIVLLITS